MEVSVIIPTMNRASQLRETLESIKNQNDLINVEVLVVDNGSTDNTKQVVESFLKEFPELIYEYNDIPGLLTGRHRGLEIAKADIVAFLDDDVILNKNYTAQLKQTFKNKNVHFATGPCLPRYEAEPPGWLRYFWDESDQGKFCFWLSLLDLGSEVKSISPLFVFGLNFCARKNTIVQLGGFHPDSVPENLRAFQGDGETGLAFKAINSRLKTIYEPRLLLHHIVPAGRLTETYFRKRAFFQGVCNSFTDLRKEHLVKSDIAAPKISFASRLKSVLYTVYWHLTKKSNTTKLAEPPPEIKEMKASLAKAEQEGYDFHHQAFKNSKVVRDWVLRENYWDYRLPA